MKVARYLAASMLEQDELKLLDMRHRLDALHPDDLEYAHWMEAIRNSEAHIEGFKKFLARHRA